jgi:hypothetical protein
MTFHQPPPKKITPTRSRKEINHDPDRYTRKRHHRSPSAIHQPFDEIVPLQEMEFDSLTQMWVAGKQVEVAPSAQRLLSNRLRVPYSYLSRCPAELQAKT